MAVVIIKSCGDAIKAAVIHNDVKKAIPIDFDGTCNLFSLTSTELLKRSMANATKLKDVIKRRPETRPENRKFNLSFSKSNLSYSLFRVQTYLVPVSVTGDMGTVVLKHYFDFQASSKCKWRDQCFYIQKPFLQN